MELGLRGRTALVTGSSRGTGEGIAHVLAREGARLLVHGLREGDADRVASEIRAGGGEAQALDGDIATDAGAERLLAGLASVGARVDVLVNNYGVAEGPGWLEGDSSDWLESYEKNVISGVRLVRALVPEMRARGFGRVIFVGTIGSSRPGERTPHYYAAKAALPALVVSLAKELAGSGITVNLVAPGLIATREVRERFTRSAEKRGAPSDWRSVEKLVTSELAPNPARRIATPEDVGALVAFLASERAASLNGSSYRIDGGAADCV